MITQEQKESIESVIKEKIRHKLLTYKPETKYMPFHYRLLGQDRMALFSFIHSLNTSIGISLFEPVAEILAKPNYQETVKQYVLGNQISTQAQSEIQKIINGLTDGKTPNKTQETNRIKYFSNLPPFTTLKTIKADLMIRENSQTVHLFDLKTAKPNFSNFKDYKRTLLEWTALFLKQEPNTIVHSYIAIPYNPYYPNPYERWTLRGMLDLNKELKVAEEFWNFLGGSEAYQELLECFQKVGMELRAELDEYFAQFVLPQSK